jgi:putative ABC transport system ATP-binding protein
MTDVLRTRGLTRHHPAGSGMVRAVDGVDLTVDKGEFVAVMGPSGCGKSSLLHLLGGLDRPTSGEVWLQGRRVDGLSEAAWARLRRRTLGFVFQAYNLVPNLAVIDNVELPALLAGMRPGAARARADELLARLQLANRAHWLPGVLSGGERQRVALARALVNDPPLLLADEPTGALDSTATTEVLRLLAELHGGGLAIVLVTHDSRVASLSDRLLTMRDGAIVDETRLAGGGRRLALRDLLDADAF